MVLVEPEVVLGHSPFGWCQTKQHDNCPVTIDTFMINPKPKKNVSPVDYTGVTRRCPCKCHGKPTGDVVKKRKPRRKK